MLSGHCALSFGCRPSAASCLPILLRLRPNGAHGRYSARSRGFSKPDVRSKTPMTASYGVRWFEAELTDDGNAQRAVIPARRDAWVKLTRSSRNLWTPRLLNSIIVCGRSKDTTMDVAFWLRDLGLQQYDALFRENDIDAEVLS